MACSEGDQLLGADFHAVLGKLEADMLQRKRTENGSYRRKDTFTERLQL